MEDKYVYCMIIAHGVLFKDSDSETVLTNTTELNLNVCNFAEPGYLAYHNNLNLQKISDCMIYENNGKYNNTLPDFKQKLKTCQEKNGGIYAKNGYNYTYHPERLENWFTQHTYLEKLYTYIPIKEMSNITSGFIIGQNNCGLPLGYSADLLNRRNKTLYLTDIFDYLLEKGVKTVYMVDITCAVIYTEEFKKVTQRDAQRLIRDSNKVFDSLKNATEFSRSPTATYPLLQEEVEEDYTSDDSDEESKCWGLFCFNKGKKKKKGGKKNKTKNKKNRQLQKIKNKKRKTKKRR